MKSTLLPVLILLTFITLISAAGSCQKLTSWAERLASFESTIMNGFVQPACHPVLLDAGYEYVWLEDADIIDGDPNGTCLESSQYIADRHGYSYSHIFNDDFMNGAQPSALCQQVQLTTNCLHNFKKCDPKIDTREAGHVTAKDHRICRWVCNLLSSNPYESDNDVGVDGVYCDINDRNYLKQFDIVASIYAAQCQDNTIYSDDDENCISPTTISTQTVAPKCELYRGSKCAAIFSSRYYVYIPSGVSQEELEAELDFDWLFLALPRDDQSCAASWQRLFCQTVFSECLESGLKKYPIKQWTTELDFKTTGIPSTHAIALSPPIDTCKSFHDACFGLPFFDHPLVQSFLNNDCETDTGLRKNNCFPADIPLTWASDYFREKPNDGTSDSDPIAMVAQNDSNSNSTSTTESKILQAFQLLQENRRNDQKTVQQKIENYEYEGHDLLKIPELAYFVDLFTKSGESTQLTDEELYELLLIEYDSDLGDDRVQSEQQFNIQDDTTKTDDVPVNDPNYQRFTTAQLKTINAINQVFHFNTKSYLKPYETLPTTLMGPQANENVAKRYALYGQVYAASYPMISPTDVDVSTPCPEPLVRPTDPEAIRLWDGQCALPCPSPRFSSKDRFTIELVSLIFVCLALIFSLLLSITFVMFHSQRHKRNLFWYTITYFIAALAMFIGLMNRHGSNSTYDLQCATNTKVQHMTGFALFQSLMGVYFFIACSCWWCMQAVELFEKLILGRAYRRATIEYKRRKIASHMFCWIVPLICVIALAVGGQLGYDGYLPFGLVAQDDQMTSKLSWPLSWFFFFLPIAACTAIGFVLVAIIFYFLAKYEHTAGLKKFQDGIEKSSSTWFKIQQSLKLFGFVFLMIPFIVIFAIHQAHTAANEQHWKTLDTEWGQMVLIVGRDAAGEMNHGYDVARVIITVFGFCTPSLVMFLLWMVFDHHVLGLWCGLLYYKLGVSFLKSWASEDTVTGSDSGGSTDSGSGSHGSTDLFSAGIGLTKKSQKTMETAGNSTTVELSSAAGSSGNASGLVRSKSATAIGKSVVSTAGQSTGTTNVPKTPLQLAAEEKAAEKAANQRRTALFKGFSKDTSSKSRGGFESAHRKTGAGTGIELGSIMDGNENELSTDQ